VTPIRVTGGRLVKTMPTKSAKIGFGSLFEGPIIVRIYRSISNLQHWDI
jgi:hypothetical protein